ncbi:MAG: hypothetical protein PVH61_00965 [Candidatus Aminicenantes bacterium]|jgi:hypothetical protein
MNVQESNKIIGDFARKLSERKFLGEEYIVYVFSLTTDKEVKNCFMRLEDCRATRKFDESNGYPIPCEEGYSLNVTFKNYQRYKYSRGGNICPFRSIVKDHRDKDGTAFIRDNNYHYWKDKHVYFCGYQVERKHLVIFLVFDFDPDQASGDKDKSASQKAERELIFIDLNPILRRVEDTYHKKAIFNKDYLSVLQDKIDNNLFRPVNDSIKEIKVDYEHTPYLQRIYYGFLIDNFSIYKQLSPLHQEKLLMLAREFEEKEKNLFIIPRYRDHFWHQLNVYLLGIAIISILNNSLKRDLVADFNRSYIPAKDQEYSTINDACVIWFIASMFHDISYPVEKSGQWLDAFSHNYLYTPRFGVPYLKASIDILNVIPDIDYSSCIDDLAQFHRELNFENNDNHEINYKGIVDNATVYKGCKIRNEILYQIIKYRDHGILSATMLLHRFREEKKFFRFLFPAAAAISIHKFLWTDRDLLKKPCPKCREINCENCRKWNAAYDDFFEKWAKRGQNNLTLDDIKNLRYISYENDPVSFLLILCDLLHDWGRHNSEDLGQAYELYFNLFQLEGIDYDDKKITFNIKIETPSDPDSAEMIDNYWEYKRQEIVKIFSRLRFIKNHDIVIKLFSQIKRPIEFSMNNFSRQ